MANLYFRDESEYVLRYRYCAFKARHSTGTTKTRWEYEARLAMENAILEKLEKEATAKNRNHFDAAQSPVRLVDRVFSYRASSEMNLHTLSRKTLQEINEAIKYWEDHLERTELTRLAKSVIRFQLKKLRTVKAIMQSHGNTKNNILM